MDFSDFHLIENNFCKELSESRQGKKTSLPFIKHHIATKPLVSQQETFQVLVVGGSVFKKALVQLNAGKLEIIEKSEKPQPPFHTKDDFLAFIDSELDHTVRVLALNFAYPLTPVFENERLDGILISGSKENTFEGLVNEKVGLSIENHIKQKYNRNVIVSCANDTICLLLSGLTEFSANNLAAGIVGTGMNFAMFLDSSTVVNLEAANFDKFTQSEEGKRIDEASVHKGKALFEKEVSGAYLYKHYNYLIDKKNLSNNHISSTVELDKIAREEVPEVSNLAISVLEYSASLIACQIAGITKFKKTNMTFIMDGSLFWSAHNYKETVKKVVKELVPEFSVDFAKVEDSTIFGAAHLVS